MNDSVQMRNGDETITDICDKIQSFRIDKIVYSTANCDRISEIDESWY